MEYVQHRPLMPLRGLAVVVAVVGVAGRRKQAQAPPAALLGEGEDAPERGLCDHRQVDVRGGVLHGAVELVQQGRTRGTRALRERKKRRLAAIRARPLVRRVAWKREVHGPPSIANVLPSGSLNQATLPAPSSWIPFSSVFSES